jgi:hypothetical protein
VKSALQARGKARRDESVRVCRRAVEVSREKHDETVRQRWAGRSTFDERRGGFFSLLYILVYERHHGIPQRHLHLHLRFHRSSYSSSQSIDLSIYPSIYLSIYQSINQSINHPPTRAV